MASFKDSPLWSRLLAESPSCTVYEKWRVSVPEPEEYIADLSTEPVSNSKVGVPLVVSTMTASENLINMSSVSPIP